MIKIPLTIKGKWSKRQLVTTGARQTVYGKEPVEFVFHRFFFVVNRHKYRANKRLLLELWRKI